MPALPRRDCGKNVRLKPTNTSAADSNPNRSGYIRPNIFGYQ